MDLTNTQINDPAPRKITIITHNHPQKKSPFEQIDPLDKKNSHTNISIENQKNMEQPKNNRFSLFEDVQLSQFTYNKLIFIEKQILFMSFTLLFCGIIQVEVDTLNSISSPSSGILMLMSLITFILIILVICRKIIIIELAIIQHKIYNPKQNQNNSLSNGLRVLIHNKKYLYQLILEVIIVSIHPTVITEGLYFEMYDLDYQMMITHSINNILAMLMLLKFYIILRAFVGLTKFANTRAYRVCCLRQVDFNILYVLKCLRRQYPIVSIIISTIFTMVVFGYGFRVAEGKVSSYNPVPNNGFQSMQNCVWFVFITMQTVGYGDFVPITVFGRVLASLLAIVGISLNSLLLVNLFQYLQASEEQIKTYSVMHQVMNRQSMNYEASKTVSNLIKMTTQLTAATDKTDTSAVMSKYFKLMEASLTISKKYQREIKYLDPFQGTSKRMKEQFNMIQEDFNKIKHMQQQMQFILSNSELTSQQKQSEFFKQIIKTSLQQTKQTKKNIIR